jgi:hypothetical protein
MVRSTTSLLISVVLVQFHSVDRAINLGWLANALPILVAPFAFACTWLLRPSMIWISIHQHRCALLLLALRALLRLMASSIMLIEGGRAPASKQVNLC